MIGDLWNFITLFFRFIGVHKMNAKNDARINTLAFSRSIFFNPKSEHWCYDNSSAQSAT